MHTHALLVLITECAWFLGAIAQATVCVLVLRKPSVRREFPSFFQYNVLGVATFVVLFSLWYLAPLQYPYAYWTASGVAAIFEFLIIREVFLNAFKTYPALQDLGTLLFRWAAVLLAGSVALTTMLSDGPRTGRAMAAVMIGQRSVALMECGLLMLLLVFCERLGMSWRHHGFGIALGMGFYAALNLTLIAMLSHFGMSWAIAYGLLNTVAYTSATLIWVGYVAVPEPARGPVQAFGANQVLWRWNQALATIGQSPAAEHAFLGEMEATVDRVLERRGTTIRDAGER